jgi:uridine kinase
MIAVAGASGSGKTYLAERLAERLNAPIVPLDAYYPAASSINYDDRDKVNYDHPDILERELMVSQLRLLAAGETIERPVYDYGTHDRSPETRTVTPGDYVVVEGLWTLWYPELQPLYSLTVYVDTPDSICYARRLDRDTHYRHRNEDQERRRYQQVREMAALYVWPTRDWAQVVVSGLPTEEQVLRALGLHFPAHHPPRREP